MHNVIRWASTHHADPGEAAAQRGQNVLPLSFDLDVGGLPRRNVKLQYSIGKQRMLLRASSNEYRCARMIRNDQ
jgi:hypothetical protein